MSIRQLKITRSITNRDTYSLEKYLQEISKIDLLAPHEEIELARLIKNGDQKALHKLTKANLRFVVSVAKQYQHQGLSLSDLVNEGNVGLIQAAQRFDETKGFKFISYAVWWIRQSILKALAEQTRMVRHPLNKLGASNNIMKAFSKLEQILEREPSAAELAEELDISETEAGERLLVSLNKKHVSFDSPISEDENMNLYEFHENTNSPKPDDSITFESLKQQIEYSLSFLPEREREVLKYYFGLGCDRLELDQIGERFNKSLTRERVRQIKDKALARLRSHSRNKHLRQYLG